jgi:hypothetical protein
MTGYEVSEEHSDLNARNYASLLPPTRFINRPCLSAGSPVGAEGGDYRAVVVAAGAGGGTVKLRLA